MKEYIEEYGLMIVVVVIVLGLMTATATFGTIIKSGVNEKVTAAVEESGITQHVVGDESGDSVEIKLDLAEANGVLPISNGGTGATTVEEARKNLELGEVSVEDIVPIAKGGTEATTAAQARVNLGTLSKKELVNKRYPVGAIYISTSSKNPSELFGGTWKQIEDRFLFASGTYNSGATGGSADAVVVSHTHTVSLTTSSAGSHTHYHYGSQSSSNASGRVYTKRFLRQPYNYSSTITSDSAGAHTHSVSGTAASTGVDGTGKNMPPYKTVYMWQRLK